MLRQYAQCAKCDGLYEVQDVRRAGRKCPACRKKEEKRNDRMH